MFYISMNQLQNNIQIAYLSFATKSLKANSDNEIQSILKQARKHNAEKGITGQLIYRSGIFLQLLEGDKAEVSSLLGHILLDSKRHENIRIILNQPMKERVFPNWSMAYKSLDNAALDIVNCIVPWQQLVSISSQGNTIKNEDILKIFEELTA